MAIDILRGIAILLVVLGHSLSEEVQPGAALTTIIYSFHMPLFFMLSGYLAAGRAHRPLSTWIAGKAKLLLVPYAAYILVAYVLKFGFADTSVNIFEYIVHAAMVPDPAGWFLYVLFGCFALLAACALAESWLGDWSPVIVALLLWTAYRVYPSPVSALAYLHWYWPFFAAAYLYGKHADRLRRFAHVAQWSAVLAYPALLALAWNVRPPIWFQEVIVGYSTPGLAALGLALGVSGTVALTLVAPWIERTLTAAPLAWLGRRTLEIYVLHEILWGIWLWDLQGPIPTLPVTIAGSMALFTGLLVGALALSWLLRRLSAVAASAVAARAR